MGKLDHRNLEEIKKSFQEKGSLALNDIYRSYREEFISFGRKYELDDDEILDVYQDAIIVFYENVQSGKLSVLTSSLKTYLFSIGKYSIYNLQKKKKKTVSFEKEHLENIDLGAIHQIYESDTKVLALQKALNNIGENCRKVLTLFYYHSYTIEAIMHEMDYKNENVVRSHKSRCLKNLKQLINEESKK